MDAARAPSAIAAYRVFDELPPSSRRAMLISGSTTPTVPSIATSTIGVESIGIIFGRQPPML